MITKWAVVQYLIEFIYDSGKGYRLVGSHTIVLNAVPVVYETPEDREGAQLAALDYVKNTTEGLYRFWKEVNEMEAPGLVVSTVNFRGLPYLRQVSEGPETF